MKKYNNYKKMTNKHDHHLKTVYDLHVIAQDVMI